MFPFNIAKWMSPEAKIEREIKRLKERAAKKKINTKAVIIVQQLGDNDRVYLDDFLRIESALNISTRENEHFNDSFFDHVCPPDITITMQSPDKKVVFKTEFVSSTSYKTGTRLEPREEGGYDVVEDYGGGSSYLEVKSYITGDWEDYLEKLYSRAVEEKNKKRERKQQLTKAEERKKFGF
jgi:hypothetical protein